MDNRKLILSFITEEGKSEKISLNYAKEGITPQEVEDLADTIIEKNMFYGKTGDYISLEGAEVQTLTVEKIK